MFVVGTWTVWNDCQEEMSLWTSGVSFAKRSRGKGKVLREPNPQGYFIRLSVYLIGLNLILIDEKVSRKR